MEIPKDGRSFLVWIPDLGHALLCWNAFHQVYYTKFGDYGTYFDQDELSSREGVKVMDEMGIWHQISPQKDRIAPPNEHNDL